MGVLVELAIDGEGSMEESGILRLRDVLHTADEEGKRGGGGEGEEGEGEVC